jgi:hypothetical protein
MIDKRRRPHTPEHKRKISEGVKRAFDDPMVRARMSAAAARTAPYTWTPEHRAAAAERMRKRWADQESRAVLELAKREARWHGGGKRVDVSRRY